MRDELLSDRLGSAIALMSASLGGGALGLPAAAFLAERADWHVLFWVSEVLGAVAFALVVGLVPESRVRTGGRFDLSGAVGLSTARTRGTSTRASTNSRQNRRSSPPSRTPGTWT